MGTHEIPWVPMDLLIDVGAACRTLPTALQHHEIHHYIFSNANENQWEPMGPRWEPMTDYNVPRGQHDS